MSKTFFQVLAIALLVLCTLILVSAFLAPVPAAADIPAIHAGRQAKVATVANVEPLPAPLPAPELSIGEQIRLYAGEHADIALAVAWCESSHNPSVRGRVDKRDRGLYQINSRWNPKVTDACAFDAKCSTEWFVGEVEAGRLWKWKASEPCWK